MIYLAPLSGVRFDPAIIALTVIVSLVYAGGVYFFRRRRGRAWPWQPALAFCAAVISGLAALESPLDQAAEFHFSAHMLQHLILTDLTAPLLLLSEPWRLWLGAVSNSAARRSVSFMRRPLLEALQTPLLGWLFFISTLWAVHFSGFYELALHNEMWHIVEHGVFLSSALWFWLPIIGEGIPSGKRDQFAYPRRMLYVLAAMPAEAFLGFVIYSARGVLYPTYAAAGLADQQRAGEIMWVGATAVMFIAFMLLAREWAKREEQIARY